MTVVELHDSPKGHRRWLCRCECGGLVVVWGSNLRRGITRSCGCLRREVTGRLRFKHGLHRTPEHIVWAAMRYRCLNPSSSSWKWYGGRGITICDRWRDDFVAFLEDVGPRPSPEHSLDRIDVDGNYEPGNVRWATPSEQQRNKRRRGYVT